MPVVESDGRAPELALRTLAGAHRPRVSGSSSYPAHSTKRLGKKARPIEQGCSLVVAQRRAIVFLAAGDEPVPTIGIAPQVHADMIDLRPVLGVEEDEIADSRAAKSPSAARIWKTMTTPGALS